MRRPYLACLFDSGDRLTPFWRLGMHVNRTALDVGAGSWDEAYEALAALGGTVTELHVWGHGSQGRPLIGRQSVSLVALRKALPECHTVWWRSCSVHRGLRGRRFALRCGDFGFASVGHTRVISAPNPFHQARICALRPGEWPWWDDTTRLRGVSTFRMRIPDFAFKPGTV